MRRKIVEASVIGPIGLAIVGTAIFAERLGLDPSGGWGRRRIALFIFGACIMLCAAFYWRYRDATLTYFRRTRSFVENHPIITTAGRNHSIVYISGLIQKYWFALPIFILVILIYIWFVSSGTWITWVSPTHYYADLARGFLKGKLYLPIKVSSNLLTSPDPWDTSIGLGLQGPLDVSYFAGKYYLYWGPVPALILLLVHPIISWRLGDLQVLFGFLSGVLLFQCLLAVAIWDRFFRDLPKYILWLSILLVGLASPTTYMLDHYRGARIYEAAITGGQFFLVSGFIAVFIALGPPVSRWRLALAGTLWALAIGARLNLALPISFMALMVAWWVLQINNWQFKKITELIPLGVPLALGFACLGWYNWARFGSITESGYFYQMTGVANFQKHYNELINPIFILQNLYNYFLYPFSIRSQFPYLYAEYGNVKAIFSFYPLPPIYFSQKITGLIYTVPFFVFAFVPSAVFINSLFKRKADPSLPIVNERRILNWVMLTLSGVCLTVFGFLFSFFWAAMRYMEDVMPALIMLGIIGFWQGYQSLLNKSVGRRFYTAMGVILIAVSISISTLVAISVNDARFEVIRLFTAAK